MSTAAPVSIVKKGGKKSKWAAKSMARGVKNELITKDHYTDDKTNATYGRVIKILGGHNVLVFCSSTNKEHLCIIRGKMRNRGSCRMDTGDIVLVDLREDQDKTIGDIILKYSASEARQLKAIHAEVGTLIDEGSSSKGADTGIDFAEEEEGFDFDAI